MKRTSFQGNLYQVENVVNSPLPVQRPMPLMVGGGGLKRTLKIAAKYADISHFDVCPSGDVLDQKLNALKSHCKTVGRDYGDIQKGIAFYLVLGDTKEDIEKRIREGAHWRYSTVDRFRSRVGPVKGDIDQYVTAMRGYMDKGVSLFTVYFVSYEYQRVMEDITVFAEEIMPHIK
ncbi:MAG: LLM class flavin-dependent oxidoreductase [Candidatus Bathyarchaeota archaeon]|nr:LLM class flavin-dependent oxidoreductase [Candidatus Bathyarchaeota archaeon]